MARSNKPVIWALFAGGGTLAAFVLPAIIFSLTLNSLSYGRAVAGLQSPFSKFAVFVVAVLILWHAAHRLRITAHDLGIYVDGFVMLIFYGIAVLGTVVALFALLSL